MYDRGAWRLPCALRPMIYWYVARIEKDEIKISIIVKFLDLYSDKV